MKLNSRPVLMGTAIALAVIAGGAVVTLTLPRDAGAQAQTAPPAPPPPRVVLKAAEARTMAPQVEVPGTVQSRQDADIAAEVAGRVTWVAEAGTKLAKGDPIARLDDRMLVLELQGLSAEIKSLQSQLEVSRKDAARMVELAAKGSAPQARLEAAQGRLDVLTQDLVRARVRHDRVALDLERAVVRAPFAGQVASRMLEVGEFSSPGAKVARLVAVDDLEVRVQAPVAIAPGLREGMTVALAGDHGPGEGRIARLIPVGEERSRTFEMRVALPPRDADAPWIVGGAVKVFLPTAQANQVVAIPRDALVIRADSTFVYRVGQDNKAQKIAVTPGVSEGGWIEVAGGLAAGDQLVVRGAERLREGQAVDPGAPIS